MTREQREDLERRITACSERAVRLFDTHAPDALRRRPRDGAWSAAECVVHLTLTSAATVPLVEAAIAELTAASARRSSPSRMDWLGRLLNWTLEPPPRLRTRTGAAFLPQQGESLEAVLPAFMNWQARLAGAVRAGEGLDLAARKITSPFDARLRYNVYSALRMLETHERRHLWQAERAVSAEAP